MNAAELNPSDPRAHLRQGVACFHLQQYEEALEAFQKSADVGGQCFFFQFHVPFSFITCTAGSDASLRQWLAWTEEKLVKVGKKSLESETPRPCDVNKPTAVKHDWYQTESHVCVTILAKNLDPQQVKVEFSPSAVRELVFLLI